MSTANTFLFRDVFPTYQIFKSLTDQLQLYDDDTEDTFNEYCYNVLIRNYAVNNIRYSTIDGFLLDFANCYQDYFAQYLNEKKIIEALHLLTLDELRLTQEVLNNSAQAPNTKPDDPTKPLPYISSQVYSRVTGTKLVVYLQALQNMPSMRIREFVARFKDLFMQVIPNNVFWFQQEGN